MNIAKKEVLAIIPARGGSLGIPRKNIAPLGGKPLIAYTIEAAQAAKNLTRLVVSTDDPEIAAVSRELGAEVPFLRPTDIAGSSSLLEDCFTHMICGLQAMGYCPDAVVFLYCTSPFRTPALIDFLTERLLEGHQTVLTAKKIVPRQFTVFSIGEGNTSVAPLRLHPSRGVRYFRSYGIFSGRLLGQGVKGTYVHVLDHPAMLVDIDTMDDLDEADCIIKQRLFDFGLS